MEKTQSLQQFTCFDLFLSLNSTRPRTSTCSWRGHTSITIVPRLSCEMEDQSCATEEAVSPTDPWECCWEQYHVEHHTCSIASWQANTALSDTLCTPADPECPNTHLHHGAVAALAHSNHSQYHSDRGCNPFSSVENHTLHSHQHEGAEHPTEHHERNCGLQSTLATIDKELHFLSICCFSPHTLCWQSCCCCSQEAHVLLQRLLQCSCRCRCFPDRLQRRCRHHLTQKFPKVSTSRPFSPKTHGL